MRQDSQRETAHEGKNPGLPPRVRWRAKTEGPVRARALIGAGGPGDRLVFVLSVRLNLYAFAENDGREVWQLPIGRSGTATAGCAAGADGLLYVGSGNGLLTAVEASTGRKRWQFAARSAGSGICAPVIGADGTVYAGSHDRHVYAVDGRTGKMKWEFKTGGYVDHTPALTASGVIAGSRDGYLYCLDSTNGRVRWRYAAHHSIGTPPLLTPEGSVIFATGGVFQPRAQLLALDAVSGERIWKVAVGYPLAIPIALDPDRGVYVGTHDGSVIALDRRTGRERWRYLSWDSRIHSAESTPPPMVDLLISKRGDAIYVAQGGEPLYVLATANGKRKPMATDSPQAQTNMAVPATALALSSNGSVIFGTYPDGVVAVHAL